MGWAGYVVSFGAVAGITTSLLVVLLGQARIYVTLGREHLVPIWMAKASRKEAGMGPCWRRVFQMASASAFPLPDPAVFLCIGSYCTQEEGTSWPGAPHQLLMHLADPSSLAKEKKKSRVVCASS